MSNTGLMNRDFLSERMPCEVYRFFDKSYRPGTYSAHPDGVEVVLTPQSQLFNVGIETSTMSKTCLEHGLVLRSYWNIFNLMASSASIKLVNFDIGPRRIFYEDMKANVWPRFPNAYTQEGILDLLYDSRGGTSEGVKNIVRLDIRDERNAQSCNSSANAQIGRLPILLNFTNFKI